MGLCSSKHRQPSLWPDLPPELVGVILCLLPSHADRLSFRAVCRQWRLAAQQDPSLPPALPWLRLNHRNFRSLPGGERRRLKSIGVFHTETAIASDGWLTYKLYNYQTRSSFLFNPFTGASIYVPPPPDSISLKTIVCSPDLIATLININTAVAFYRLGAPSWSVSRPPRYSQDGHQWMRSYSDIALHRGKLYGLTNVEELFSHELVDDDSDADRAPKASHVAVEHVIKEPADAGNHRCFYHYLVASCDDRLLMVGWWYPIWVTYMERSIKEKCEAIKLHVFEADLEMGRWIEVKDGLNGQALFISRNCSKMIRVCTNDQKFQGDHVYFLVSDLGYIDRTFSSYLFGSYDLRNNRINRLFWKGKRNAKKLCSPEWFFPCM
ncbi:hypothetical protein QOZ80_9AG0675020 [Eleusine coracana subsp. coracana]|nr:hypothetical protein QOZ80_9AG0675020 [Eleusine coracana subsp. coracana]